MQMIVEGYDPETVEHVQYLDSLRNLIFKYQYILSDIVPFLLEILLYCETGNVLFYMIDLSDDIVFMTFMYVYNLIVSSCYFTDFVILYS